jgi:hypothetical protein
MKRPAIVIAAVIIGLGLAGLIGLICGYMIGFGDAAGQAAPGSAAYSASMLKTLRSGDSAQALSMLESQLDSRLMERWAYDQSSHMLSSLLSSEEIDAKLMGFAAEYRAQHPTESDDAGVEAAIAEVVTKYRSGTSQ